MILKRLKSDGFGPEIMKHNLMEKTTKEDQLNEDKKKFYYGDYDGDGFIGAPYVTGGTRFGRLRRSRKRAGG
jgi:hypothetical protein